MQSLQKAPSRVRAVACMETGRGAFIPIIPMRGKSMSSLAVEHDALLGADQRDLLDLAAAAAQRSNFMTQYEQLDILG